MSNFGPTQGQWNMLLICAAIGAVSAVVGVPLLVWWVISHIHVGVSP